MHFGPVAVLGACNVCLAFLFLFYRVRVVFRSRLSTKAGKCVSLGCVRMLFAFHEFIILHFSCRHWLFKLQYTAASKQSNVIWHRKLHYHDFFLLFSLFLDFFVTRFFSSSISIINWIAHPVDSALCLFIWFFIEKFIYFDSLPISARPGHAPPAPIMNCRSERARTNYIKFRADGVRSPNDWFDKYKTERESILEKSDSTTTIEWREGERETEKSSVVANVLSYCVNANIIANYWSDMHSYTGTHRIQYNPWIFSDIVFIVFIAKRINKLISMLGCVKNADPFFAPHSLRTIFCTKTAKISWTLLVIYCVQTKQSTIFLDYAVNQCFPLCRYPPHEIRSLSLDCEMRGRVWMKVIACNWACVYRASTMETFDLTHPHTHQPLNHVAFAARQIYQRIFSIWIDCICSRTVLLPPLHACTCDYMLIW